MIKYTRHAKRRMKLYRITDAEIKAAIELVFILILTSQISILDSVVCKIVDNDYLIITCYPLKEAIKK